MTSSESYDPIPFTNPSDIERVFGKKAQISYIRDLENKVLDKNNLESLSSRILDQLTGFVQQTDKGSDFEKNLKNLPQTLSNKELVKILFNMNYGMYAKILPYNEEIVSFIAYQEDTQNNIIKVFKMHTDEAYRGGRLSYHLIEGLLLQSQKDIQVGKGPQEIELTNSASQKTVELFKENGYHVDENNFIIKNKANTETMTELVKKYGNGPLWKSISGIIQDKTKKEEKRKKEEEEKNMREKNMETFNLLMHGHDGKNLPPAARQVHHKGGEESEYF